MLKGKDRDKPIPGPAYMSNEQMAHYLKDLRHDRPPRPCGSRPPPPSKFGSVRRAETVELGDARPLNDDRPPLPTSASMPIMPQQKLQHRRTESSLSSRTMNKSPFAGRPLARAPSASPERSASPTERPPVRRTPSMSYMENGMRWMEKQEAKSLRQALEDMDLEEEQKIHAAARDEAAELVWKHRNPEAASGPFRNPDLKDYRSHLRKGSYERTFSQGSGSTDGKRSASDGSQHSSPGENCVELPKYIIPRKASPPTGSVSVQKRRESNDGKSYDQLAKEVAKDIAVAHRRSSSGSKRIMSGEKKRFMNPDDRIWEDPSEDQPSPRREKKPMQQERRDSVPAASTPPLPSHVRKNPFARVRAQYDKMERSNSAPTLQTLPGAISSRHDRIEIHRNPPSQSRNPLYMSNEPLVLPPTPPRETEHEADEVAPKMTPTGTPTKDGIEIRGDDIRAATSKSRRDYSPGLPRPTMVSDKPGRPIVSFEKDWKLKEVMMEEHQMSPLPTSDPTAQPFRVGEARESPQLSPVSPSKSAIPHFSVDEASLRRSSQSVSDESPSKSRIPKINVDDVPKWTPFLSRTSTSANSGRPRPSIDVNGTPKPPIPTISTPDEPAIPTIAFPDDSETTWSTAKPSVTVVHVDTPPSNAHTPSMSSPPKSKIPQRPLPSINGAPSPGRPLPRHANSTPVPVMKSTLHTTPSMRQSGTLCAHCALPIAGRILSAAGERFHPGCFVCNQCNTNLECVAFYPEPEKQRNARVARIQARQHGMPIPIPEGASPEDLERWEYEDGDPSLRFYCHLDFHEMFSPRCKSCKTPIEGEVIVACGAEWHAGHFFCAQCGDPFDSSTPFVEKDGYAWCVGCHTNRYSSKCRKCKKPVTDVVIKALGSDWHGSCFVCTECNDQFEDGRYFLRGESKDPVCVRCEERRLKA